MPPAHLKGPADVDVGRRRYVHTGCFGKTAFVSAAKAMEVAKRTSVNLDAAITSYRCRSCGRWHLGSSLKKREANVKSIPSLIRTEYVK